MPFRLENSKKSDFNLSSDISFANVRNLNRKQNLTYKTVENHFRNNVSSPLLMIITGQGGPGKSFVINVLRKIMYSYCIVSSYFSIAIFNVNRIT